ncbi:MAG: hypothetical protein WKG07_10875 [Hymenobacter sp.]
MLLEGGGVVWEWGDNRPLSLPPPLAQVAVRDFWRAPAEDANELFTAAFTQALFRRPAPTPAAKPNAKPAKAEAAAARRALCAGRSARGLGAAGVRAGLGPRPGQLG